MRDLRGQLIAEIGFEAEEEALTVGKDERISDDGFEPVVLYGVLPDVEAILCQLCQLGDGCGPCGGVDEDVQHEEEEVVPSCRLSGSPQSAGEHVLMVVRHQVDSGVDVLVKGLVGFLVEQVEGVDPLDEVDNHARLVGIGSPGTLR